MDTVVWLTRPNNPHSLTRSDLKQKSVEPAVIRKFGPKTTKIIRRMLESHPESTTAGKQPIPQPDTESGAGSGPDPAPPEVTIDIEPPGDSYVPLTYLISDLHLGNARPTNDAPQDRVMLMDQLIRQIDRDADSIGSELPCTLVLVGDILDLWAAIPTQKHKHPLHSLAETKLRLEEVLTLPDNQDFFFDPIRRYFLRDDRPNRRLVYVIGNHDDAFLRHPQLVLRLSQEFGTTRFRVAGDSYQNPILRLHAEHGNAFDPHNAWSTSITYGQLLVENFCNPLEDPSLRKGPRMRLLNQITRRNPQLQELLTFADQVTPDSATIAYLAWLETFFNEPRLIEAVTPLIEDTANAVGDKTSAALAKFAPGFVLRLYAWGKASDEYVPYRTNAATRYSSTVKVVVLGHTHIADAEPPLRQPSPVVNQYVNTGAGELGLSYFGTSLPAYMLGTFPPIVSDQATAVRVRLVNLYVEVYAWNWGGWAGTGRSRTAFDPQGISGVNLVVR